MNQINKLKEKLNDNSITTEEKNTVFEELKLLNNRASKVTCIVFNINFY